MNRSTDPYSPAPVPATGRVERSLRNLYSGTLAKLLGLLLSFLVRSLFIACLGNTFLSINGLYTNILGMLSLAELGFGTTVVYSMYRPLAEKNYDRISTLLRLYRNVYVIVGLIITVVGAALVPFLPYLIRIPAEVSFPPLTLSLGKYSLPTSYFTLYYLLSLLNVSVSYWFWGYRHSVLTADQKEYVCTDVRTGLTVLRTLCQLAILLTIGSRLPYLAFTLYLTAQVGATILSNVFIARRVRKLYPNLSWHKVAPLPHGEVRRLAGQVGSNALTRLCHVALNSTDNIIISSLVGTLWVGRLSNYTLVTESLVGVLCLFTGAITSGLGNYFVEKTKEDGYRLFCRISFANLWLYGACAVALGLLLTPFMTVWIGDESYLLSPPVLCTLIVNFFVAGYMNTLWTFRAAQGLFTQGWFRPLLVALINVGASILLGYTLKDVTWGGYSDWGVFGVLIATFIARACISLWYEPLIVIRHGFGKSPRAFFRDNLTRFLWLIGIALCLFPLRWLFGIAPDLSRSQQWIRFLLHAVFTCGGLALALFLICRKRDEYRYVADICGKIFRRRRRR